MEFVESKGMAELMNIFRASDLSELPTFPGRQEQLALVERQTPQEANAFFETLMQDSFGIAGKVRKENAEADIRDIVLEKIPVELQSDSFYDHWITDMSEVCKSFCDTQESDAVCFWLGTNRGCRRYHIDNVPLRALVTYAGQGTEYVPDHAADRRAYAKGAPNELIVKDPSSICFMNTWDVAVFRGGADGLLHRTPDAALKGSSILMRLDHPSFWDRVLKESYDITSSGKELERNIH